MSIESQWIRLKHIVITMVLAEIEADADVEISIVAALNFYQTKIAYGYILCDFDLRFISRNSRFLSKFLCFSSVHFNYVERKRDEETC